MSPIPTLHFGLRIAGISVALGAVALEAEASIRPTQTEPPGYPADFVPGEHYRWEHLPGKSLTLAGSSGIVFRLNFSKDDAKPHVHLHTADGRPLTWAAPPDHVWHLGLWHSWKFIDGVNYWGENSREGGGTTAITRVDVVRADKEDALVRMHLAYHPNDAPDRVVMNETVELRLETPRDDGSYCIDWLQEARAGVSVLLDRTPPPGEPGGKDNGGYAGLSFRGSEFLTNVSLFNSSGARDLATHRKPARWMALLGEVDGRVASIAIFDHPSNPRHPTPWFVVLRSLPHGPFWYFNPAILSEAPYILQEGQIFVRRYRVRVGSFGISQEQLDSEFQRFAATVYQPTQR
jgi:hypothetical protein